MDPQSQKQEIAIKLKGLTKEPGNFNALHVSFGSKKVKSWL